LGDDAESSSLDVLPVSDGFFPEAPSTCSSPAVRGETATDHPHVDLVWLRAVRPGRQTLFTGLDLEVDAVDATKARRAS